ncbi:MAG: hypothetical protein IJ736_01460 [Firmicutes bacterium]|nr:hypothetical protein [Bacillota bacterium]
MKRKINLIIAAILLLSLPCGCSNTEDFETVRALTRNKKCLIKNKWEVKTCHAKQ